MPQLGPHIYPDTKEGIEAYNGMKARLGAEKPEKATLPSGASVEPEKAPPKGKKKKD